MADIILVTGANGQLGNEIRVLAEQYSDFEFVFTDVEDLDITNETAVSEAFKQYNPKACINSAAYTAVDRAESQQGLCYAVNADAPAILAKACKEHGATYVHVSTDFVFDGEKNAGYVEDDAINPSSVYGKSKAEGEKRVLAEYPESIIVRTAWVYSSFGNNFVKTMLRLADSRDELSVVADQVGSPTYAADLADALLTLMMKSLKGEGTKGIFHFSNEGTASWYDFAHAVFELGNKTLTLHPIKTVQYPTPAARPKFSLLDKTRFKTESGKTVRHWREALRACMEKL